MRKRLTLTSTTIVVAVALVIGYGAYLSRYVVLDSWCLRSYHPSAQVSALANRATMTATGRRLFYRANPQFVTTPRPDAALL